MPQAHLRSPAYEADHLRLEDTAAGKHELMGVTLTLDDLYGDTGLLVV